MRANDRGSLNWRGLSLRLVVTVLALVIWFLTQAVIGARTLPSTGVADKLHEATAPLNSYFYRSTRAADALLIVSSGLIDAFGIFLLGAWLFGGSVRPFLGLLILLGLRQAMQAICVLPTPPNMVWHNPGFPSLFVTYSVGNDYFFSAHTALAVFGATEIQRFGRVWLTGLAVAAIFFEIATVLVLRAHYTMDVFTGVVAALWVAYLCERVSPHLDRLLLN